VLGRLVQLPAYRGARPCPVPVAEWPGALHCAGRRGVHVGRSSLRRLGLGAWRAPLKNLRILRASAPYGRPLQTLRRLRVERLAGGLQQKGARAVGAALHRPVPRRHSMVGSNAAFILLWAS